LEEFTRSQISGAITQLVDCGDLKRIERGLFVGRDHKASDKTGQAMVNIHGQLWEMRNF